MCGVPPSQYTFLCEVSPHNWYLTQVELSIKLNLCLRVWHSQLSLFFPSGRTCLTHRQVINLENTLLFIFVSNVWIHVVRVIWFSHWPGWPIGWCALKYFVSFPRFIYPPMCQHCQHKPICWHLKSENDQKKDGLKNEDDLNKEDQPKNEDDPKNEDNLKKLRPYQRWRRPQKWR